MDPAKLPAVIGITEIAALFGVSHLYARHRVTLRRDFPAPVRTGLKLPRIWWTWQVLDYWRREERGVRRSVLRVARARRLAALRLPPTPRRKRRKPA